MQKENETNSAESTVAEDKPARSRAKHNILIVVLSVCIAVMLFVWVVVGYLLYVVCDYSRLPDVMNLTVRNNLTGELDGGGEYRIMTYNVGFGAYSQGFTFFMDTGVMKDGTPTQGNRGTAISAEDVNKNITGAAGIVGELSPDFAILQEVDYDSTRSYGVDQRAAFDALDGYCSVFAQNYHSSYLFYPFSDPHGKNNAGIMTLSRYGVKDSTRYAFPIDEGLAKFTDLDRCYSVTHIGIAGSDKKLAVISLHMSAYDEGGVIRKKQAEMLKSALEAEYEAGNYVIAGGDFNQDLIGNLEKFDSEQRVPEWVSTYDEDDIPKGFRIYADGESDIGTCRGADIAWERGVTYMCVIDGFIVSDNVEVRSVKTFDSDFEFSDHNPVVLDFKLL